MMLTKKGLRAILSQKNDKLVIRWSLSHGLTKKKMGAY